MPNKLIHETSPYLLQHAQNPVNWYPWGKEALQRARDENKLILVSIGYSACHWCHVMEHESFEDKEVAEIMNNFFVCIKIDREERPDIDQVYMTAVQLMTGSGGWPLNCICLPDQRPVYGGTYFRKHDWMNLLLNLAEFWKDKPDEAVDYAEKLTAGIHQSEKFGFVKEAAPYTREDVIRLFEPWKRHFDMTEGGYNRAPKFPLSDNWQFMLRYAFLMNDNAAHVSLRLTLQKMAFGGIYDQLGGGFARYSVDEHWHVPHFEKMLYDNAQLVSLYAASYQYCKDELYRKVVYETIGWVKREMTSPEGAFYSALDADSEGVEGKFYTFDKGELTDLLGEDEQLFCIYYNVTAEGNWEEEHTNILLRKFDDDDLAEKLSISKAELLESVERSKAKVFAYRDKRVRPGLDNKILASWNGLMIRGLTDAYRAFEENEFLDIAVTAGNFIAERLLGADNSLCRLAKAESSDDDVAFLDDYAMVCDAFISLYEVTFNESWLQHARSLANYVLENFLDRESGLFYYTSGKDEKLIARKFEVMDNVIPSSNSVMAHNLHKLGLFFDDARFTATALQMLRNVFPHIKSYGSSYSNWASLLLLEVFGMNEIAITGNQADTKRKELEKVFIPNKIVLGGTTGTLPLLRDKWSDTTRIFTCKNRTCQLPVTDIQEAINQITNMQE